MKYMTIYKIDQIYRYLGNKKIIAFDFETSPDEMWRDDPLSALDAHKSHITGISLSVFENTAVYIPLAHKVGRNVDNPEGIMKFLRNSIFENPDVVKVAHNLVLESMFLYAMGIIICEPCYDTIAAAQLTLKNNTEFRKLKDSGLKKLAYEFFDADMASFDEVTNGRFFDELNPQDSDTIRYACADSDYTLRLYYLFNNWFDNYMPRHRYVTESIESPTSVYVGMMKYNGIPVDRDLMLKKQAEAENKIESLKEDIQFIIGDINIGANASTSAFKKYLYKDLGLPVLKTTAKFQEAADDEALVLLKEWCEENRPELTELFVLVQEYRKWGKLKSTYIDGYLKYLNNATGRIHADLLPMATETGRFASRNPNLQNCPRKDNDPVGVRSFIKTAAGNTILSLDFSQIELRVGAFYCRDSRMLNTYRTGGDIHAQTTSVIYKIPFAQAADKNAPSYKERRTIAKNCNFGTFYGLFPKGLQRTLKFKAGLNTSVGECEKIINNLKAGYPELVKWQEDTKRIAELNYYTETWLGRRRYLRDIVSTDWGKKSFAQRCALNTPIQGTAADILKLALGRLIKGLPERQWLKPLLQVHDELVFELPEDKLQEAVEFIKECMETRPFNGFDVPIIAEAAAGSDFGNMKELE